MNGDLVKFIKTNYYIFILKIMNDNQSHSRVASDDDEKQPVKTLDIDGHRPIDPSHLEIKEVIDIDGNRPVTESDFDVCKTIDVDGHRPVTDNKIETKDTIDIDGHRPVDPSTIEVQETINIDGNRPIAINNPSSTTVTTDYID